MDKDIFYQMKTKNVSFIRMHRYLVKKGISNNKFFLAIYDKDLLKIDPRDTNLSEDIKKKIVEECKRNYWYFIREVVMIPVTGTEYPYECERYELTKGSLALGYCKLSNINTIYEAPVGTKVEMFHIIWYLWLHLFDTNCNTTFLHQHSDNSIINLYKLKTIRSILPSYIIPTRYTIDGKTYKIPKCDSVRSDTNYANRNNILVSNMADTYYSAQMLLRGNRVNNLFFAGFGYMKFNIEILNNGIVPFSRSRNEALNNNIHSSISICTNGVDMRSIHGINANDLFSVSTLWEDIYYDLDIEYLNLIAKNSNLNSIYIKLNHTDLELGEDYIDKMKLRFGDSECISYKRQVLLKRL